MPIILDKYTDENARILVWKDEEKIEFFLQSTHLSEADYNRLEKFTSERRKKDLLIARHLLQKCIPNAEIQYHDSGKPYIKNKKAQISISHSKDVVAIIIHQEQIVGIDIEYIAPRVERVKERFLSKKELDEATTTELLILYWSAKETLYKLDKEQGLDFINDISISPCSENRLTGSIRKKENFTVHYSKLDDLILTYAVL